MARPALSGYQANHLAFEATPPAPDLSQEPNLQRQPVLRGLGLSPWTFLQQLDDQSQSAPPHHEPATRVLTACRSGLQAPAALFSPVVRCTWLKTEATPRAFRQAATYPGLQLPVAAAGPIPCAAE